ncbi:MAG TPA: right-handed parallel beta-helix repeat-containing protein [Arenibaculum sp.]|nr:right-handed parallel beta-helix repeat-containing protein [Arenibaculum sp.]
MTVADRRNLPVSNAIPATFPGGLPPAGPAGKDIAGSRGRPKSGTPVARQSPSRSRARGAFLAAPVLAAFSMPFGADAPRADEPLRFDSCADLSLYLESREPHDRVRLAPETYECSEPLNPAVDGLHIDFGGTLLRVADNVLRPAIVLGNLHTPPERRHTAITVLNLRVDGNRANQEFECWGGPCDPAANDDPFWQQRLNGVTVNGCDDCALINVAVSGARSGGVVVVHSRRLLVDGLEAERSYFDGLAGYTTYDSVFRNVRVRHNDYSGFSFDLDFSGNRIEGFESSDNSGHGLFIRYAVDNVFAHGSFSRNGQDGVYFDRAHPDRTQTCAEGTRLEGVGISGNGRYGAWLDFECASNEFASSVFADNRHGDFGGRRTDLIGWSDGLAHTGAEPEAPTDSGAGI